jgi:hypothetical protein
MKVNLGSIEVQKKTPSTVFSFSTAYFGKKSQVSPRLPTSCHGKENSKPVGFKHLLIKSDV